MEIKNVKNLTDYLSFDKSSTSTKSSSNSGFDSILSSTDTDKFQKDSQKHYLKNKKDVNSSNGNDKSLNKPKTDSISNKDSFESIDNTIREEYKPTKVENNTSDNKKVNEVDMKDKIESATNVVKELNVDDEAVKEIATILNITPEKVVEILNDLNLTVEDLASNENVADLIVKANDLLTKVDILTIPNIKEQMQAIKDVAQNAVEEQGIVETANTSETVAVTSVENTTNSNENSQANADAQNQSATFTKAFIDTNAVSEEAVTANEDDVEPVAVDELSEELKGNVSIGNNAITNEAVKDVSVNANTENVNGISGNVNNTSTTTSFVEQASKSLGNTRTVDTNDVIKQLTDAMKVEIKSDISNEIKITLRPAHLGDVTLRILSENGIITAQFEAQNQRVKEIIESQFNALRDSLAEQGVEISSLNVNVSENNESNNLFDGSKNENRQNRNGDGLVDIDGYEEEIINTSEVDKNRILGSTNSFEA